jgi:hypothetical protein
MSGLSHLRSRHFGGATFYSVAGGTGGVIAAAGRKARLFIVNVGRMMGM